MLKELPSAPSVQFHKTPRDSFRESLQEPEDPDVRVSRKPRLLLPKLIILSESEQDKEIVTEKEFYNGDQDQDQQASHQPQEPDRRALPQ